MGIRRKSMEKQRKSKKKHLKQQKRRFEHIWDLLSTSGDILKLRNRQIDLSDQGNHRFGAHIKGSDPGSRRGFGRVLDIERKDISGSRSAAFDLEIISFGLRNQSFYPFFKLRKQSFCPFSGSRTRILHIFEKEKGTHIQGKSTKTFQI